MKEPKFKVGDIVGLKYHSKDNKLHIIEVHSYTCPGGTQIRYTGRLLMKKPYEKDGWGSVKDPHTFNETEVEEWVEENSE